MVNKQLSPRGGRDGLKVGFLRPQETHVGEVHPTVLSEFFCEPAFTQEGVIVVGSCPQGSHRLRGFGEHGRMAWWRPF